MSTLSSMEAYKKRWREAEIFLVLADSLSYIKALLRFQSKDVYELSAAAMTDRMGFSLEPFRRISGDFSLGWRSCCLKAVYPVSREAYSVILEAGSVLGQMDLESQLQRLSVLEDRLRSRGEDLTKELRPLKKLHLCLGAFFGLMIIITLI